MTTFCGLSHAILAKKNRSRQLEIPPLVSCLEFLPLTNPIYGSIVPSKYLADDDHIMRYIAPAQVLRDSDTNEVVGFFGAALNLKPESENYPAEEYLSVTWCDYFEGSLECKTRCSAEVIRNSITVRSNACFAMAQVKPVRDYMLNAKRTLRFIHEPDEKNPAHAAVRHWPKDTPELFERMAQEVWTKLYSKADIDAMQLTDCPVSVRGAQAV